MYAAVFAISGWMGLEHFIFKGKTASEILVAFEEVQSLSCLARMGRSVEQGYGQRALDKIDEILNKHYTGKLTVEDLLTFDIKTSLGIIKCIEILEGDDAVEKLKASYPKALLY